MAHQFPFIDTDHSTSSTTIANLRADYDQFGVDSSLNLNVSGVSTFGNTVSIGATVFLTGTLTDGSTQVGAAGSILSSTGSGIRWIAANTTNVNSATNVGTNANATDADQFVAFMGATSGNNPVRVDAGLKYNPSSNRLFVKEIVSTAGNLELQAVAGENALVIKDNNAVELYFDGSGTYKLATTDIGVDVRGELESDRAKITGVCTATSFVRDGGSSSQFLKADGSVDTNTYLTSESNTTYSHSSVASGGNVNLRMTAGGSGSGDDDILMTAGNNITFSSVSASGFTIAAASGTSSIPSGSVMIFYQASAPTGWTKVSTIDNKALRVVSGTGGGSGGNHTFTTVFSNQSLSVSGSGTASGTTGSTVSGSTSSDNSGSVSISGNCGGTQSIYTNTTQNALSVAQLAAHQHAYDVPRGTSGGQYGFLDTMNAGSSGTPNVASTGSGSVHHHAIVGFVINGSNFTFSGSGSPSNHDHDIGNHSHSFSDSVSVSSSGSLDMRVQYIDVIICTKD